MFIPKKAKRIKKWGIKYSTLNNWKNNFYIGLARGVGTAIGFTVLGAIVLFIINIIPLENIPFIGKFLTELGYLAKRGT